jgi:hypothetical protein
MHFLSCCSPCLPYVSSDRWTALTYHQLSVRSPSASLLLFLASPKLFGYSTSVWVFFLLHSYFVFHTLSAVCIGGLYSVTQPVLRSKITKLVKENEYATVFIGAGVIESIGHQAVGIVTNNIYKVSLNFFPGLTFIVFALISLVAIIIMG